MKKVMFLVILVISFNFSLFAGAKGEVETNSLDPTARIFIVIEENQIDTLKDILQQEMPLLNILSDEGETPLTLAASLGHKEIVLLLLNNLADRDKKNSRGETALLAALGNGHFATAESLLLWDADVTLLDSSGESPLFKAVKQDNLQIAKKILAINNELIGMDDQGNSPLHWAVKNNNKAMVELLMQYYPSIIQENNDQETPLSLAIASNNQDLLTTLLKDIDLKEITLEQGSLLHFAVIEGDMELCRFLIDQDKMLMEMKDSQGRIPLFLALERNKSLVHMEIAKMMIEKGSPEAQNSDLYYFYQVVKRNRPDMDFGGGKRALHIAAENNHEATLELLLRDYNTPVDLVDENGNSALLFAVKAGNEKLAEMLLGHGANANIQDISGLSPMHHAVLLNNALTMSELLVSHGASVNLQDMLGNAPIHRVILYDLSVDRMEMLLNQDADPLIRNIKGNTALLVALFKGKDDMIKLLQPLSDLFAQNQDGLSAMTVALSSPIEIISWFFTSENINLKDIQGNSVMHLAAGYSNGELPKEKILLLIEKGALLNSRNAQGKTPLHLAVEAFYPHTANLLVNQGANMYLMDNQNYSPLLSAFERGADMTQSFLLEDESIIDLQDNLGNTPLFHAIKENYNNIATLLVNLGSDYDHRNLRGITPLLLTIENGETDLFYLLLDHGADINRGDNKGDGALHYLVRSRNQFNRTLAQALLEYGIQPDLTNDTGMTALHYSTLYKNGPALVFLVESGASVDLSDQQGFTPIFYAVLENDISAYNYLVEQGANIHIRDYQGNSLLHVAIVESLEDDNQDLIRSIIRHGGDIYGTNAQGDSPLSLAVTLGPMILDRMLFSQSVNRLDNQGNSPLHRLLELSDNPQMWGIAVARGANLSLRNSQGKTAYQWGLELGYTEEELTGLRP